MAKVKRKLTSAQKRAKKEAKAEMQKKYTWVFINGKQVRVKKPPTIDGMNIDEYIQNNADPTWLHQNEALWDFPWSRTRYSILSHPAISKERRCPPVFKSP